MCDYINTSYERYASTWFIKLRNQHWWDISKSSANKWKNGLKANGEAFFGSSTFLVAFTDAWHCFKACWLLLFCLATAYAFVFGAGLMNMLARHGFNLQNPANKVLYLAIMVQIALASFGLGWQIGEKTIVIKKL